MRHKKCDKPREEFVALCRKSLSQKKNCAIWCEERKTCRQFFIWSVKENGRKRDFVSFKVHEKVFFERMDSNTKIHGTPKKRK